MRSLVAHGDSLSPPFLKFLPFIYIVGRGVSGISRGIYVRTTSVCSLFATYSQSESSKQLSLRNPGIHYKLRR